VQGGWDPNQDLSHGLQIHGDLETEINQAFANCELNLKNAGGKGWSQVYRVTTYSTDVKSQFEIMVANLKKWMPDHKATWTLLGVKELGLETMHFEIDVEAYDEEGAEEARKAKATSA
jgi:enamine deaminase RidA (YjgF/YER057c/UK114 family)